MCLNTKYLPAEWAEQEFVQITFPHHQTDWSEMLDEACLCFAQIIENIACRQNVLVVCADIFEAKKYIANCNEKNIQFAEIPSNDTWARDHAAITIFENSRPTLLDFTFNGWGLKFAANLDNLITEKLYKKGCFPKNFNYKECRNFVFEGGSIESDGQGTIMTTEKCLLSDNRNYLTKREIEDKFKEYFGAKRVLWLKNGYIAGDDTDSHIDTLVRFSDCNTIIYVKCEDEKDEHFAELKAMEKELQVLKTDMALPYRLIALPMADAVYENGERLPATYANFLIINEAVLLPTYNSPKDEIAAKCMQTAFPTRQIIKINCLPLIKQHGSLHCVTMQFPKII
ncbi:MAG: agmatine deiminase family protein [Prevotellaceae bacterium]|jgi:agmatine/peptidylarginine deiminase|nr:agmatine deiminase family protein [Prevotellaceae bacterium]